MNWNTYIASAAFSIGVWLVLLGIALAVAVEEATIYTWVGMILPGMMMVALSWFVFRRHNWARIVLIAALVIIAVIGSFGWWGFGDAHANHTFADRLGIAMVGVGFLLFPVLLILFLTNPQVVCEFRRQK
jgi:hypothetical protein